MELIVVGIISFALGLLLGTTALRDLWDD
jgi:hypothetical protein